MAGRGGRVIRGRSLPYGESGAYSAFAQQVKQVADILDSDPALLALEKLHRATVALLGAEEAEEVTPYLAILLGIDSTGDAGDRLTLFFAPRRFVEALSNQQPTVLVFEDVQWADPTLLDLLHHLASRIRESPVMMLALARPEFVADRPSWGAGLPAYTALPLEPLDGPESRELARRLLARSSEEAAPETVARLAETGEGNPLFIEELVASLAERSTARPQDLPTSVRGIVAGRLDALPAAERAVLLDASIVGKVFWVGVLRQLGDRGDRLGELLDLLEGRDLIRREPASRINGHDQFRFKHILIREVAYGTLPRAKRRTGHAIVARFLEETGTRERFTRSSRSPLAGGRQSGTSCRMPLGRSRAGRPRLGEARSRRLLQGGTAVTSARGHGPSTAHSLAMRRGGADGLSHPGRGVADA